MCLIETSGQTLLLIRSVQRTLVGSLPKCLPTADVVWFPIEELPTRSLLPSGSKEERLPRTESGVPWRFLIDIRGGPGGMGQGEPGSLPDNTCRLRG